MKKREFIPFICCFLLQPLLIQAQVDSMLIVLDSILFPYNAEDEKSILLHELEWRDGKHAVYGRKNQPEISDGAKIYEILRSIRAKKDVSVMPTLVAIQEKHEEFFVNRVGAT